MTKRKSTREILQERTYPMSRYDFPSLIFLCRYCGRPVLLEQLSAGSATETEHQRFNDQDEPETYAYSYYHQRCRDNYEHRIALRKMREAYQRGY